jgi:hypothetical protein
MWLLLLLVYAAPVTLAANSARELLINATNVKTITISWTIGLSVFLLLIAPYAGTHHLLLMDAQLQILIVGHQTVRYSSISR